MMDDVMHYLEFEGGEESLANELVRVIADIKILETDTMSGILIGKYDERLWLDDGSIDILLHYKNRRKKELIKELANLNNL